MDLKVVMLVIVIETLICAHIYLLFFFNFPNVCFMLILCVCF